MDTKRQEVEEKRDKLNNKIKNLYAPITGNRILHESAIRAIEKHHSKPVRDVLKDICERKDAEELENWRGFYSKVTDISTADSAGYESVALSIVHLLECTIIVFIWI